MKRAYFVNKAIIMLANMNTLDFWEGVAELRNALLGELVLIATQYRKKSKYKKYSKGMKSAFKNRAVGIEE